MLISAAGAGRDAGAEARPLSVDRGPWSCRAESAGVASSRADCPSSVITTVEQIKLPGPCEPGLEKTSKNKQLSLPRAFEIVTTLCKHPLKPLPYLACL